MTPTQCSLPRTVYSGSIVPDEVPRRPRNEAPNCSTSPSVMRRLSSKPFQPSSKSIELEYEPPRCAMNDRFDLNDCSSAVDTSALLVRPLLSLCSSLLRHTSSHTSMHLSMGPIRRRCAIAAHLSRTHCLTSSLTASHPAIVSG